MGKLQKSLGAKLVAVLLLLAFVNLGALSFLGCILVWDGNCGDEDFYATDLYQNTMNNAMHCALYYVTENEHDIYYLEQIDSRYAGFSYQVYAGSPEDGVLLGSSASIPDQYARRETLTMAHAAVTLPGDIQSPPSSEEDGGISLPEGIFTVVGYLAQELPQYSSFSLLRLLYDTVHPLADQTVLLLALSALASILLLVFLLSSAGHRSQAEGITPNWQDRIPLDIYLAITGTALFTTALMASEAARFFFDNIGSRLGFAPAFACALCILLSEGIVLAMLMTLATRLKLGAWWRNTLCWRLLRRFGQLLRRLWRSAKGFLDILPLVWQTILAVCGILFIQIVLMILFYESYSMGGLFFLAMLAFDAAVVVGAGWLARQLQQLQSAGQALAEGNLEQQVDTEKMFRDLKAHGQHLNAIGEGMNRAVEQRLRSERLKTELITNVSHDIKTPLTSIVNYIDLLKKEQLSETAADYVAVLDRQSYRLKKLTEDLVEASKASTGNVAVHLEPIVVNEIIHQAIGDYSEKLSAGKLEVVVNTYEGNVSALADGRLLWRVLDNLLSNVCKYALAGTRVYVDLGRREQRVTLSVKNISRDPLNINPNELMERFVRGDASRHTEGSGLGLNIAQSLMELMGGSFALSVDGDLFKAELTLQAIPSSEESR